MEATVTLSLVEFDQLRKKAYQPIEQTIRQFVSDTLKEKMKGNKVPAGDVQFEEAGFRIRTTTIDPNTFIIITI